MKSTQKITKAMQMVAASKMRRTQERMRQGRPYAEKIRKMIGHLANSNPEYRHVYMTEREVKRIGYIVVSTDKGLCGGLNVNLFRALVKDMQRVERARRRCEFALIGNKAASFFRSYGGKVSAMLNNIGDRTVGRIADRRHSRDARRVQRRDGSIGCSSRRTRSSIRCRNDR